MNFQLLLGAIWRALCGGSHRGASVSRGSHFQQKHIFFSEDTTDFSWCKKKPHIHDMNDASITGMHHALLMKKHNTTCSGTHRSCAYTTVVKHEVFHVDIYIPPKTFSAGLVSIECKKQRRGGRGRRGYGLRPLRLDHRELLLAFLLRLKNINIIHKKFVQFQQYFGNFHEFSLITDSLIQRCL